MTALTKFDELRLKTDEQLAQLLRREIDLGICYVLEALRSPDGGASAEGLNAVAQHALAQRIHSNCRRLLPVVEMSHDERVQLQSKLARLREMVRALSAVRANSAAEEEKVALLANALWKARGCPEGLPEEDWFQAERALKCHAA